MFHHSTPPIKTSVKTVFWETFGDFSPPLNLKEKRPSLKVAIIIHDDDDISNIEFFCDSFKLLPWTFIEVHLPWCSSAKRLLCFGLTFSWGYPLRCETLRSDKLMQQSPPTLFGVSSWNWPAGFLSYSLVWSSFLQDRVLGSPHNNNQHHSRVFSPVVW